MFAKRRLVIVFCFLLAAGMLSRLSIPLTGLAAASRRAPSPTPPTSLDSHAAGLLLQQGARISTRGQLGNAHFIGADPRRPIHLTAGLPDTSSASQAARAFLAEYGKLFGLKDQARELAAVGQKTPDKARTFVRFQQISQGIPVFGGELNVQITPGKELLSVSGELSPAVDVSMQPAITAVQAGRSALLAVAKWYGLDIAGLTASDPQLWIYDPALLGPEIGPARLVWRMDVSALGEHPLRELILVDAQSGSLVLHYNQIQANRRTTGSLGNNQQARNTNLPATHPTLGTPLISVYTMNHSTTMLPGTLVCSEIDPWDCDSDPDAQLAYRYALDTYNYYATSFGRDSIDGSGMRIISSVHFGVGYQNAFWDGSQMIYGDGFAQSEDVVGHELTHGVTQYESGLFYYYQSGAINESFSDVFGEFIDQSFGDGPDDWLIGEHLTGMGPFRDMSNPPAYGDPDRMTSPNYDTDAFDNGGVHRNSGINNKAVYLMTAGGSFNGQSVGALGAAKVARIYYEVQSNLMTSGADYADLYDELYQGCLDLVGTAGITLSDCQQVRNATNAVEMDRQPTDGYNPDAPLCASGQVPKTLFLDNFENGAGNFTFGTYSGTNQWMLMSGYAHSGMLSMLASDIDLVSDSYVRQRSSLSIPAGAYLHFAHAYDFEVPNFDGGVVEYSSNGGSAWNDANALFDTNGYNGSISKAWLNPLGGRAAFVGTSHGFVSSRLNLSSLAGKNVMFRWRQGTDDEGGSIGWIVDDIHIYTCPTPTATPTSTRSMTPPPTLTRTATGTTTLTATQSPAPTETETAAATAAETATRTATIAEIRTNTPSPTSAPTTTATQELVTQVFSSLPAQDGWMLESSENSSLGGTLNSTSATFNLGDDSARRQFRAMLSFNTSGLPDTAVITGISLRIKKQAILGAGNPVNLLHGFMVDMRKGLFGSAALQPSDFQRVASRTFGPFKPAMMGGWYRLDLSDATAYINKLTVNSGLTQIRLRFAQDDNNDKLTNCLSLYSGNAAAGLRPQLVITYTYLLP